MPGWLVATEESDSPEFIEIVSDILLVINVWVIEIITQNPNIDATENELIESLLAAIVSD